MNAEQIALLITETIRLVRSGRSISSLELEGIVKRILAAGSANASNTP